MHGRYAAWLGCGNGGDGGLSGAAPAGEGADRGLVSLRGDNNAVTGANPPRPSGITFLPTIRITYNYRNVLVIVV